MRGDRFCMRGVTGVVGGSYTMKRKIKEALTIKRVEKERGKDRTLNQDTGLELSKIWLDLV